MTITSGQPGPAQVIALSAVTDDLGPAWAKRLAASCTVTTVDRLDDAEPGVLAQAEGLLLGGEDAQVDADLLSRVPRLRIVALRSDGYDTVDLEACADRGVIVTNAPGVLDAAVADHTILLLLAAARRLRPNIAVAYSGENWERNAVLGVDVRGKTLGLVGMGRIASMVARTAQAGFGMEVLYHNRSVKPDAPGQAVDAEELYRRSDFVSLHVPLDDGTRGLVGARELGWMPRHAYLINTARGPVVDEAALVACLQSGGIAGAALDVTDTEPYPADGPLTALDNVLLTPHMASGTAETRQAMSEHAAKNLLAVLSGEPPLTPVTG
jgi:lactate dehydrogenase-like 2-hydroxyacid dehydrogenase